MTDDLLREIQQAQVEAAEDAVVASLRRKGLLPPPEPATLHPFPARAGAKVGVVIPLGDLRRLMREFIDQHADSNSSQVRMEWTFETFLQWLRKRQTTTTSEEESGYPNFSDGGTPLG